jgi:hypothetical protein
MKRFTALILIAAICVGSMAHAGFRVYGAKGAFVLNGGSALGKALSVRVGFDGFWDWADTGEADYEPGETGDWTWAFGLKSGFRSVESNLVFAPGDFRIWETDLDAHAVNGRWAVSLSVPYQDWEGYGVFGELGGKSLGLQVAPQYFFMKQDSEAVDLSVFAVAGYKRLAFDGDPVNGKGGNLDDASYVTWGFGALIGKSFSIGDLSLGYVYQPWINIDGDAELDGSSTLDYHSATLTYAFGLGGGLYGSLAATWNYTEDLPDQFDSDEYLGRAMLGYRTECWGIEAGYGRTILSDDFDEWDADLSVSFKW